MFYLILAPRLFSRFTISTTSQLYIRVDSAELKVDTSGVDPDALGGVEVVATGMRPNGGIVGPDGNSWDTAAESLHQVVTPAHPANFLFRITSEHGPVKDTLRLQVKYRTLHEGSNTSNIR
jgi:trafficking protein particle complex subunit 10